MYHSYAYIRGHTKGNVCIMNEYYVYMNISAWDFIMG